MRESTKSWLLASAALIVLGGVTFTATACAIGWDFSKFSTVTLETNTYTISEDFNNITLKTDTTDITLLPSENGECKVVCYEDVKQKHSATVENGVLTIQEQDERAWYDYLDVGGNAPTITVYLPKAQYTDLSIDTSTGDINISNGFTFNSVDISGSTGDVTCSVAVATTLSIEITTGDITLRETTADSISLTLSTGDIAMRSVAVANTLTAKNSTGSATMKHVSCKNFTRNSNSGDLDMENVLVTGKMHIEQSTGDVEFEHCEAGEIYIKTTTGDIEGSFLTAKVFPSETCNIVTSTGDIEITVAND